MGYFTQILEICLSGNFEMVVIGQIMGMSCTQGSTFCGVKRFLGVRLAVQLSALMRILEISN